MLLLQADFAEAKLVSLKLVTELMDLKLVGAVVNEKGVCVQTDTQIKGGWRSCQPACSLGLWAKQGGAQGATPQLPESQGSPTQGWGKILGISSSALAVGRTWVASLGKKAGRGGCGPTSPRTSMGKGRSALGRWKLTYRGLGALRGSP